MSVSGVLSHTFLRDCQSAVSWLEGVSFASVVSLLSKSVVAACVPKALKYLVMEGCGHALQSKQMEARQRAHQLHAQDPKIPFTYISKSEAVEPMNVP